MKPTLIGLALFGALAMASPVQHDKRYVVTEVVWETQTVTVTAKKGWGSWGRPGRPTQAPSSSQPSLITTPIATPQPAAPSSSSAAPSSTLSSSGSVSSYADPILLQHNLHRANHSAGDLRWDAGLADIARQIAESCHYAHDTKTGGGGYGQNIGAGSPDDQVPAMITNLMYNNEIMDYPGYDGEPDMSNFEKWGHFSQIVWKETDRVGCYTQHCPNGLSNTGPDVSPYFTVCNYLPVGNMAGTYGENVLKPLGKATITVGKA